MKVKNESLKNVTFEPVFNKFLFSKKILWTKKKFKLFYLVANVLENLSVEGYHFSTYLFKHVVPQWQLQDLRWKPHDVQILLQPTQVKLYYFIGTQIHVIRISRNKINFKRFWNFRNKKISKICLTSCNIGYHLISIFISWRNILTNFAKNLRFSHKNSSKWGKIDDWTISLAETALCTSSLYIFVVQVMFHTVKGHWYTVYSILYTKNLYTPIYPISIGIISSSIKRLFSAKTYVFTCKWRQRNLFIWNSKKIYSLNIFGYLYIRMVCKLTSGKLTF